MVRPGIIGERGLQSMELGETAVRRWVSPTLSPGRSNVVSAQPTDPRAPILPVASSAKGDSGRVALRDHCSFQSGPQRSRRA
jgi:hypothetical protein